MLYSLRMDLFVSSSEEDMLLPVCEYRPHRPQDLDCYGCVRDYSETFVGMYKVEKDDSNLFS